MVGAEGCIDVTAFLETKVSGVVFEPLVDERFQLGVVFGWFRLSTTFSLNLLKMKFPEGL